MCGKLLSDRRIGLEKDELMSGHEEGEEEKQTVEKEAGLSGDGRRVEETNGEGISFQTSQFHQGDSSLGSNNCRHALKLEKEKKKTKTHDALQTVRISSRCATPVPYLVCDAECQCLHGSARAQDSGSEAAKSRKGRLCNS